MNLRRLLLLISLSITLLYQQNSLAQMSSITYCDEMPMTQGNANDTLRIPKFDRNLGTLNNISISLEINGLIEEYLENFELNATGDIFCNHMMNISSKMPTNDVLVFDISKSSIFNLGPFDGVVDFAGTSGETRFDLILKENKSWNISYDSSYLKDDNQDIIKIPFTAISRHQLEYEGDCRVRFITYSTIKLCIHYYFSITPGSIGDYVWIDENGDGLQDPAEAPLPHIVLHLIDEATNQVIDRDTTDNNGNYLFQDLLQGNYRVLVDPASLPEYYTLTTGNLPFTCTLAQGEQLLWADFGYRYSPPPPGSIGDYVWIDENGDGLQDPAEAPLPHIVLHLIDEATNQMIDRDTTDNNGNYLFHDLPQGNYRVLVDPASLPEYYTLTTGNLPFTCTLAQGEQLLRADFGYRYSPPPPGSIGDYVWHDENGDGLQDPAEAPLPLIVLHLIDEATNQVIDRDTTDSNGNYLFQDLPQGNYRVLVDPASLPEYYTLTTGNLPFTCTLAQGEQLLRADFGYRYSPPPPVIANFTADPTEGISPLEVTFTNTSENATQARWDFGDDSCSEEWSPIHTYTNPPLKHYTVTLIVWNDQGDSDTLTCTNLIKIFRPAHSDFNAMSIAGRPDDDVQFINHCGGLVNSFTWDYGDGIQEIFRSDVRYAVHPIHTYQDSGSYEVTLTASGQGGSDTLSLEDYIFIHDDYCKLQLIDSSETEAGFGWSNVIDHDVLSDRSSMRAPNSLDVLATFMFADSSVKKLHTVRFKCNDAHKRQPQNNLARRFEVLTSEDGDHFHRCVAGYLNENERWETYRFEPVTTKYIKLNFRSARKRKSPYITMCEFQVCASPLPPERETIELVNISGREAKGDLLHKDFRMFQNYPNPFNPTTTINCYLPDEGVAELKIYDIRGSIVYSLSQTVDSAGLHAFKWTGSDHNGQPVRSGIYIYRLIFNTQDGTTYSDSGRMVLLK